jgi:hypothetical protein
MLVLAKKKTSKQMIESKLRHMTYVMDGELSSWARTSLVIHLHLVDHVNILPRLGRFKVGFFHSARPVPSSNRSYDYLRIELFPYTQIENRRCKCRLVFEVKARLDTDSTPVLQQYASHAIIQLRLSIFCNAQRKAQG